MQPLFLSVQASQWLHDWVTDNQSGGDSGHWQPPPCDFVFDGRRDHQANAASENDAQFVPEDVAFARRGPGEIKVLAKAAAAAATPGHRHGGEGAVPHHVGAAAAAATPGPAVATPGPAAAPKKKGWPKGKAKGKAKGKSKGKAKRKAKASAKRQADDPPDDLPTDVAPGSRDAGHAGAPHRAMEMGAPAKATAAPADRKATARRLGPVPQSVIDDGKLGCPKCVWFLLFASCLFGWLLAFLSASL